MDENATCRAPEDEIWSSPAEDPLQHPFDRPLDDGSPIGAQVPMSQEAAREVYGGLYDGEHVDGRGHVLRAEGGYGSDGRYGTANGNVSVLGARDVRVQGDTENTHTELTAGDMTAGRLSGSADGGQDPDGTYRGRARVDARQGVSDVELRHEGHIDGGLRAGEISNGGSVEVRGTANTEQGTYAGRVDAEQGARARDLSGNVEAGDLAARGHLEEVRAGWDGNVDADLDTEAGRGRLRGDFAGGGVRARNLGGTADYGDEAHGDFRVGEVNADAITVRNAELTAGPDGAHLGVDEVAVGAPTITDVEAHGSIEDIDTTVDVHAGSVGNSNGVRNVSVDIDGEGVRARMEQASVGGWSGEDIGGEFRVGDDAQGDINLGSFSEATFEANDARLDIDENGVHGGTGELRYDTVHAEDLEGNVEVGDVRQEGGIREVSIAGGDMGRSDLDIDEDGLRASTHDTNVQVFRAEDVRSRTNVGDGQLDLEAGDMSFGRGTVDEVNVDLGADEGEIMSRGNRLDIVNLENAQGSLAFEGMEVAHARTGFDGGTALDEAGIQYQGDRVRAGFEGAALQATLDETDVNIGDNRVRTEGMRTSMRGSSHTELDLGALSAHHETVGGTGMHVGPSELDIAGHHLEGEEMDARLEARATGDANLRRGRASGRLDLSGGIRYGDAQIAEIPEEAHIGGSVDVREGQVDLDVGGTHIDVDEAVRDTARSVERSGRRLWNRLTDW